ncbi:Fc.00g057640.m01.CDS01 [Cosmosporella sp. VM-42]
MRLLKASSIDDPSGPSMIEPPADQIPRYAILSHTWGSDEILFAHVQAWNPTFATKESFIKVRFTCLQAIADDLEYVWIDSCCINKASSAELSEAINSMYQWYQAAEVCYTYLADVAAAANIVEPDSEFAKSRWFTRGWTLQELLAPADLIFYSKEWSVVGQKTALSRAISHITGISEEILTGAKPVESASVAKRMSWASHRKTTRREDVAYCLMGLFGVNMPMLYGEGDKAFLRLQEEIMKLSDDQSLFAWVDQEASTDSYHGLLAKSPLNFAHSNAMLPYEDWEPRPPYNMTSRGLCIDLPVTRREDGLYVAALDCPVPPDYEDSSFLAIYLKKMSRGVGPQFARVNVGKLAKVHERGPHQTIFVRQNFGWWMAEQEGLFPQHVLQLRRGPPKEQYRAMYITLSPEETETPPKAVLSSRGPHAREWLDGRMPLAFKYRKGIGQLSGAILFSRLDDDERVMVLIGSMDGFKVGFQAIELEAGQYPARFPRLGAVIAGEQRNMPFDVLQTMFKPGPVGRDVELEHNRVRVDIESTVRVDTKTTVRAEGETSIAKGAKYLLVDILMEPIHRPTIVTEAFRAVNQGLQVGARLQMQDPTASEFDTKDEVLVDKGDSETKRASKWRRLFPKS